MQQARVAAALGGTRARAAHGRFQAQVGFEEVRGVQGAAPAAADINPARRAERRVPLRLETTGQQQGPLARALEARPSTPVPATWPACARGVVR